MPQSEIVFTAISSEPKATSSMRVELVLKGMRLVGRLTEDDVIRLFGMASWTRFEDAPAD